MFGACIAGEYAQAMLWFDTSIEDGTPVPITSGFVLFWGTDTKPERLSCLGAGSTVSQVGDGMGANDSVMVQLNLSAPKSCPGTPIAGSLGIGLPGW